MKYKNLMQEMYGIAKSEQKKKESINEAKYKQTYKSITARDKDSRRIWGSQIGHPRVKVTSWSEVGKTGRMKTAYIEIEGDKDWVDAYKKIAFSGKGNFTDVVKSLKVLPKPTRVEHSPTVVEELNKEIQLSPAKRLINEAMTPRDMFYSLGDQIENLKWMTNRYTDFQGDRTLVSIAKKMLKLHDELHKHLDKNYQPWD